MRVKRPGISFAPILLLILLTSLQSNISSAQIRISEIRLDQPGPDVDEYAELAGPPGSDLSDMTYVVIGDGAGGSGVVEMALALTGLMIPEDGYALLVESSFTLDAEPDLVASLNFENTDNVTHLVVAGFSGTAGLDLDEDDDGLLDLSPWSSILDCVSALDAEESGDRIYCETTVGPSSGAAPFHVFYDGGWQIGAADPQQGLDTPGAAPSGLLIEIVRFDAVIDDESLILRWTVLGDDGISGYRVSLVGAEGSSAPVPIDVPKNPRSLPDYQLPVRGLKPGGYRIELSGVSADGTVDPLDSLRITVPTPAGFVLGEPYPNPSSGEIRFDVHSLRNVDIDISVFDATGRRVERVFRGPSGHETSMSLAAGLDGLPRGVYFIVARGGPGIEVRPVVRL